MRRIASVTMTSRGARRLLFVAAIVGLVTVLLATVLVLRPWDQPSASPATAGAEWQPTTAWEKTLARIGADGSVDLDTALVAFSLAIAPLPGVTLPTGERGVIDDGSEAVRWLRSHWDELTEEQRTEAQRHLVPAGQPGAVPGALGGASTEASGVRAASLAGGLGSKPISRAESPAERPARAALDLAIRTIATHLRRDLNIPVVLTINAKEESIRGNPALAYAVVVDAKGGASGAPHRCYVWMNPSGMALDDVAFTATIAHEAYHCFQGALNQSLRQFEIPTVVNSWVVEGQAEWVGETIAVELAGSSSHIGEGWWAPYLYAPKTPLITRSYDAIGFYARLGERGQDPWLVLDSMITAANGLEAFHLATDKIALSFADSWATGYFREPVDGPDWDIDKGVALPALGSPKPALIPLANGDAYRIDVKPFANAIFLLDGPAEVVRFQITGHGRLVEATELEVIGLGDGDYCLNGPCVCPPGMHFQDGEPGVLNAPLKIGVSGFTDGALGSIVGLSIRDLCSPDTTPRPSGSRPVEHAAPRCGTRCPSSNGDPHLRTVDGVGYSFQAAGEFVLLRSPDGKVEIQVRQEPAPGVELGRVSNNTALAIRLGERRVGIYATATGIDVRVDGLIQDGDLLDVGGSLVRHDDGIEIELPDGSIVWAVSNAPYGLNLLIDPSPPLVETGVGLLGRSAPGLGVPLLPDGSALPKPIDRHEAYASLYVRFAGAWRLTDATTLFDYEAGKATASYTIADYPSEPKVAAFHELDPAAAAAGREACAPIADAELRDECAFDVAVTGDAGYVGGYVVVERVAQQGTVALDPPDVEVANAPVEVFAAFHALAGSSLGPDGTLYVSGIMSDRSGLVLAIDPTTGSIVRQVATTGAGEVAFAAGSVWVGEFSAPATGGFQPCSVSRLDPTTLNVLATIPTTCDRVWQVTDLAAVGDDVWFEDSSTADATGTGATLRLIETATNTVAASKVAVPFPDGELRATTTAVFYGDPDKGQFRLRPGESTLSRIGDPDVTALPTGILGGDGIWATIAGRPYALYTSDGGPDGTIDLNDADGGTLVGADTESVYVERTGAEGGRELWRRYLDGRVPVRLAAAGSAETGYGPIDLVYFGPPTLLVGETSVVKLWVHISRTEPAESLLLVQGARLP